MDARLYLIATPALCARPVTDVVALAIDGGVGMVQLRDKAVDDATFLALARDLVAICRPRGVPLVLNDRVHLVENSGADGAHVGEEDLPPEEARRILGPDRLLGISTHDAGEVAAARGRGADHAGLGPMFATGTKSLTRTPRGPDLVREAAEVADLPLFPIGGITATNLPLLVEAGAERAAVSAAICSAADPREAAEVLRSMLP